MENLKKRNIFLIDNITSFINKLYLLLALNILDGIFTLTLFKTGLFTEINPLLSSHVDNTFLFVFIKFFLASVFILFIIYRIKTHKDNTFSKTSLIITNAFLLALIFFYILIILSHLYNTFLLLKLLFSLIGLL